MKKRGDFSTDALTRTNSERYTTERRKKEDRASIMSEGGREEIILLVSLLSLQSAS